MDVLRGDKVLVNLAGLVGHETGNSESNEPRPCVVIQNDRGNKAAPHTIVVPIIDRSKTLPVHVAVTAAELGPGGKDSIIQCEQIRVIDETRVVRKIGTMSADVMKKVDAALRISLEI